MMPTPSLFISCDWGTSSFRLRLVERANLRVLKEIRTANGIRSIFERSGDRGKNFGDFLSDQLQQLEA